MWNTGSSHRYDDIKNRVTEEVEDQNGELENV